jgi:hypothetical protein
MQPNMQDLLMNEKVLLVESILWDQAGRRVILKKKEIN